MSSNPTQTIYVDGPNPPSSHQSPTFQQPPTTQSAQPIAESPNQANNQNPDPNQNPQGQVFYKIIDVITEWQRGNFLPALHCLRYNLIPKDFLDFTGYNVLHHAVSQGSVPITLILLDYFRIDVNIRSANNQTPLMIACNYGLIDIIRILCERGAFINEQDDTRFSALLYTVKQGRIPQFAYLLHQKADPQVRDANGCTAIHWAAYKNNVFLLKILHKLGLDLNAVDFTGLTALDRAAQSGAYEAVQFLLENGDGKKPANLKFDQIASNDIKSILRKKYWPSRVEKTKEKCGNLFKKHLHTLTVGTYVTLWISMMAIYLHQIANQVFTFDIIFFLSSLFSITYSLWYYLKSHEASGKGKSFKYESLNTTLGSLEETLNTSTNKPHSGSKLNFEALDKLVKGEHKGSVIHEGETEGYASFLHELAALFEAKNYKEIARFNEKDYCADCLIKRTNRSGHCKELGVCVPRYQHYSECLGTAITDNDHYLYLLLLVVQFVQLGLFISGLWVSYADDVKNMKIFIVYIGQLLWKDYGLTYTVSYTLLFIASVYNFVFLSIELYGVLKNETYYEMFDRANCTYLFRVKQDKKGAFVKSFKNPYDHGIKNNLNEYFAKLLHFDTKN